VRWDSPFVLAAAGTIAIHLIAITAGDAIVVTHPPAPWHPAPHLELVEIEVPPVLQPPPPPPPPKPDVAPPPPAPVADAKPRPRAQPSQIRSAPAPAPETKSDVPVATGGDEVVHMDDIAPGATGVAVAPGKPASGRVGRGGNGGGTGAGSGAGSGSDPKPVSVATIKTRALPKGDYGYVGEYPAEARALGIEGDLRVRLVVDEQGKVKTKALLNRLGHGLDELALQRVADMEFEPAKDTDDKPVASVVVWTFHMTLPK
jgi:periplasmic protein TonB